MSVQLLDKTRKINKLLTIIVPAKLFSTISVKCITEILNSNILVVSKKGKVLGISKQEAIRPLTELIEGEVGGHIDTMLNERLLSVLSTKENVNLQTLGFDAATAKGYQAIISPIEIAGGEIGNPVYLQAG